MSYIPRLIEKILRNVRAEDPCTLAQLLLAFDAHDRTMLGCDEVSDALRALISDGRVMEVAHLRYAGNKAKVASTFTGISEDEHEAAVLEAGRVFRGEVNTTSDVDLEEEDEEREWITVRWVLEADGPSDDVVEERAGELAEQLEAVLEVDLVGGVLGFEMGPGVLEIHIEALDGDSKLEPLVPALVEICRGFGSPTGSVLEWLSADRTRTQTHPLDAQRLR